MAPARPAPRAAGAARCRRRPIRLARRSTSPGTGRTSSASSRTTRRLATSGRRSRRPSPSSRRGRPAGRSRGSARELDLEPCERFLLALAMLPGFDSAAGAIVAACVNDPAAVHPTLALAQRLWDEPVELLTTAESGHRLERHGLLERAAARHGRRLARRRSSRPRWSSGRCCSRLRARRRSSARSRDRTASGSRRTSPPASRSCPSSGRAAPTTPRRRRTRARWRAAPSTRSPAGSRRSARRACSRRSRARAGCAASTCSWSSTPPPRCSPPARCRLPSAALRLRLLLAVEGRGGLAEVPPGLLAPAVHVPPLSYEARVALWRHELGSRDRRATSPAGSASRPRRSGRSPAACGETARSRPSGS